MQSIVRSRRPLTLAALGLSSSLLGCAAQPKAEAVADASGEGAQTTRPLAADETPLPTCLVLSVGAERGLAHLGVVAALRERGVDIDCVAGTSMGSLIGGLTAMGPGFDPAGRYQSIFADYKARSFDAAGPLGVGYIFGFRENDWSRLRDTLRWHFEDTRIESLPVGFLTAYQTIDKSGIHHQTVRGGVLADEIARSIRNPLLFPDVQLKTGEAYDPGTDRLAAVPLASACEAFPERHFIVSNVTKRPAVLPKGVDCSYQELMLQTPDVDAKQALQGEDPAFGSLLATGFRAAQDKIDWSRVVEGDHADPPLQFVDVSVRGRFDKKKKGDEDWDAFGGAPDPRIRIYVRPCHGCNTEGTSAQAKFTGETDDGFVISRDLGLLRLRKGFGIFVELSDADVMDNDSAGTGAVSFDGRSSTQETLLRDGDVRVIFTLEEQARKPGSLHRAD